MPPLKSTTMKRKVEESLRASVEELKNLNIPCIVIYMSNHGVLSFGTPAMTEKFSKESNDWNTAILSDQEYLNHNNTVDQPNDKNLKNIRGECPPPLLPADLSLMRLVELIPYVQKLLLKNHWALGGQSSRVIPGIFK